MGVADKVAGGVESGIAKTLVPKVRSVVMYRLRDVGESGVPYRPDSHAQATSSLRQARGWVESRGAVSGRPQELVRINAPAGSFTVIPHPSGPDWYKFNREIQESDIRKLDESLNYRVSQAEAEMEELLHMEF